MGATAITVLAAARILALPATLPVLASTRQVVSGLAFLLWAYGTWWIPLLLAFGVWRHLIHREPVSYEPTLWSMVFPLGMYAVASASYGWTAHLGFMVVVARVEVWVGFAAWVAVAAAMGRSLLPAGRRGSTPASPVRSDALTTPAISVTGPSQAQPAQPRETTRGEVPLGESAFYEERS